MAVATTLGFGVAGIPAAPVSAGPVTPAEAAALTGQVIHSYADSQAGSLDLTEVAGVAPKVTQIGLDGLDMPITFHAVSALPGITEYVAQLYDDPASRQSVPPGPDGSATFQFSVAAVGQQRVVVHAVNADGMRSTTGSFTWRASDYPLITSTDFPRDTASRLEPGTFTFTPRRGGTTSYEYAFNGVPGTVPANADGTGTLRWMPPAVGDYTLTVRSVSAAGVRSVRERTHVFAVEVRPTTVTEFFPEFTMVGAIRKITLLGSELTARDTVTITPLGGTAITAKVLSVSADRAKLAVEADLRTAKAGNAKVVLHSAVTGAALPAQSYYLEPVPLARQYLEKGPRISGPVKVGNKISVDAGHWWPGPFSSKYQWKANGVAIKGATASTYTIPASLLGKRLTVTESITRTGYHPETVTSPSTGVVAKGAAAKATKKPTITGTAKVGRTVTAAVGTWSPKATSHKYEWRLNGKVIKGKTGRTLKLTSSMRNKKITVRVIAKRTGHLDGSATSAARKVTR